MSHDGPIRPDHPVYLASSQSLGEYLGWKERVDASHNVERLRLISEAQFQAATDFRFNPRVAPSKH